MPKTLQELLSMEGSTTPFAPIPKGDYTLHVVAAENTGRHEIQNGPNAGEMTPPAVDVQFAVVDPDGEHDRRRVFHRFYISQEREQQLKFAFGLYERVAGKHLAEALANEEPTDEEIADAFAAGIPGGTVQAGVSVRKRRGSDVQENYVARWIDSE